MLQLNSHCAFMKSVTYLAWTSIKTVPYSGAHSCWMYSSPFFSLKYFLWIAVKGTPWQKKKKHKKRANITPTDSSRWIVPAQIISFFFSLLIFTGKFSVMSLNSFVPLPFSQAVSGISISTGTNMWILVITFKGNKRRRETFTLNIMSDSQFMLVL